MNIITKSGYYSQSVFIGPRIYQLQYGRRNIHQIDAVSAKSINNQKSLLKCPFARTCSLFCIFRNTDVLYSMSLSRSVSYFSIHPERLKQMVKLQSSQNLVNVLASDEYKRRLLDFMEEQKSYLTDGRRIGLPETEIKYEHMIDCAQPNQEHMTEKGEDDADSKRVQILIPPRIRRPIKTTVMAAFMKKKVQEQEQIAKISENRSNVKQTTILPILMETRKKNLERRKKFRRRTTILPIILKKITDKKMINKSKPSQEPIIMVRNVENNEDQHSSKQQMEATAATTAAGETYKSSDRKVVVRKRKIYAKETWTDFDRQFREKQQEVKKRSHKEDIKSVESVDVHHDKTAGGNGLRKYGDTQLVKRPFIRSRSRPVEDVFSLFDKVKTGSMNRIVPPIEDKKAYSIRASAASRESTAHVPSLTYKIVCKEKARHQQAQKARFKFNTKKLVEIKKTMKANPKKDFIVNVDDIVYM